MKLLLAQLLLSPVFVFASDNSNARKLRCKAGKAPPDPTAKSSKAQVQVPSILAKLDGEFAIDDLEWPPDCPGNETDEECKQILCNGVQTFLQNTLCTGENDNCNVVVPCYEVTQDDSRKLELDPKTKTKLLHRALEVATSLYFTVSLLIECVGGDCSDPVANRDAALAAMGPIQNSFGQITDAELIAGVKAAILALDPPPAPDTAGYFNQLTLSYNPATSSFSEVKVIEIPPAIQGFEFAGEGWCMDSAGNYYGYIYTPDTKEAPFTLEQCATACLDLAGSTCWNPAAPPLRGFDYYPGTIGSQASDCACRFEVTSGKPTDLLSCASPPATSSSNSRPGVGPVFTTDQELSPGYTCFKYIG